MESPVSTRNFRVALFWLSVNRFRPHILVRLVALLAAFTTLTVAVAPNFSPGASYTPYGSWVRTQLNVPSDEAVERILGDLAGERFGSLESFLLAFVEAYEEANGSNAADLFGVEAVSAPSLVAYLQSRYSSFAGEALPARYLKPYVPAFTGLGDRAALLQTHRIDDFRLASAVVGVFLGQVQTPGVALMLRSVIQPQGP